MSNRTVSQPICDELFNIFTKAGRLNNAVSLRRLVAFYSNNATFDDGSQQDTGEFLLAVTQCIYEEVTQFNIAGRAMVNNFYGIDLRSRKFQTTHGKCPRCNHIPGSEEQPFQVLTLNVPNLQSNSMALSSLVISHFSESSDSTNIKCPTCCICISNCPQTGPCRPKPSVEQLSIVKTPDILLINLNRHDIGTNKNQSHIVPDEFIYYKEETFCLKATIDHIGSSQLSGHYIAHVKTTNGIWYT